MNNEFSGEKKEGQPIMRKIEVRFGLLSEKLKVAGRRKLVQKNVKPLLIKNRVTSA